MNSWYYDTNKYQESIDETMRKKSVIRKDSLDLLSEFRDNTEVIKVIRGVRRCGKSTLMLQYIDLLKNSGVDDSNIIYINLESSEFFDACDGKKLLSLIKSHLGTGRNYVLIDEIQNAPGWEIAINSLRVDTDSDIYITGSNAYLLSSELSTYLTGRYVSIEMFPLSFTEFLELNGENEDKYEMFEKYLTFGAFPSIDPFETPRKINIRLLDLYSSIIYRDVISRGNIRDSGDLDKLVRFMMYNVGNPISFNKISESLGVNRKTVERYLMMLEESYVFYRADRYDISKTALNPIPKYYAVDTGLRNMPLEYTTEDYGRLMENIVYIELKRRGHSVRVERYGDKEVDFSVKTDKGKIYYQVTYSMMDSSVRSRELRSLNKIDDNYPKIVISADRLKADFEGGIRHINIIDWLLDTKEEIIKNY